MLSFPTILPPTSYHKNFRSNLTLKARSWPQQILVTMNWLESHRCRRRGYISCYQTPPKSRLSLQIPLSKVQVPKKEVNSVKRRINIRIWIPNLANLLPPRPPELAAPVPEPPSPLDEDLLPPPPLLRNLCSWNASCDTIISSVNYEYALIL